MNDVEVFDRLADSWNTAMAVVTARAADGHPTGCLVGFQGQVSIDPVRWGVWMSKVNHTYPIAIAADLIAVHFLTEDQHHIAEHFGSLTGDKVDKFAGVQLDTDIEARVAAELGDLRDTHPITPPVLADCPNRLIGRRTEVFAGETDHSCVVLEPVIVECQSTFPPLRLMQARDIEAGHPVDPS